MALREAWKKLGQQEQGQRQGLQHARQARREYPQVDQQESNIDPDRPIYPFFVYSSELDPEHGIDKNALKNFMNIYRDSKTEGDFTDNVLIQHFRNLGWIEPTKHKIYKTKTKLDDN